MVDAKFNFQEGFILGTLGFVCLVVNYGVQVSPFNFKDHVRFHIPTPV